MAIIRDKLWFFGVRAHQDDIYLGKNWEDRFTRWSRITPAEGAHMLDVPNIALISCDGVPAPFSEDARGYAESFCRMEKVLWSSTGGIGFRTGNEEKFICQLAEWYPNIHGAFMDDFFFKYKGKLAEAEKILKEIREGLNKACRPMKLYCVLYMHELDDVDPYLFSYVDGVAIYTWNSEQLPLHAERFDKIEKLLPNHKKLLGVYIYDYTLGMPTPLDLMEHQCEFGLEMIKQNRLDGLIFTTNSVMGVGLPSEKWLRGWIDKVKNIEI